MRRTLLLLLAAAVVAAACTDTPVQPTIEVEPSQSLVKLPPRAGAGPVVRSGGAFQAALDAAAAEAGASIVIVQGTIELDAPLVYQGSEPLVILGRGARVVGPFSPMAEPTNSGDRVGEATVGDALQVIGAPDLTVQDIRFEGSTGQGIYVELPAAASGTVEVSLTDVTFDRQGLAGLWIEDQESTGGPIDSNASIHLAMERVEVLGTGFAADADGGCPGAAEDDGCPWADFDGVRVNEGGVGDVTFDLRNVRVVGNAADGIEFDETGPGDVVGSVENASFDENGPQPQFPEDLEDGFDIDEAGPGSIVLHMERVSIDRNVDEGLDLDEEGTGDIDLTLTSVGAAGNADDNVKLSEDADLEDEADTGVETGDIRFDFTHLTADGALDGDGVNVEEFGRGRITGSIDRSKIRRNADDGLQAEQDNVGPDVDGEITITRSNISGNGDDDVNPENVTIN